MARNDEVRFNRLLRIALPCLATLAAAGGCGAIGTETNSAGFTPEQHDCVVAITGEPQTNRDGELLYTLNQQVVDTCDIDLGRLTKID